MTHPRIAIGGLFMEANHLGGPPTDLACFTRCQRLRGAALLAETGSYVGGMLDVLRGADVDIVPLVHASTNSGGPITTECHKQLKGDLLDALSAAGKVDGVLLSLHGSASADGCGDVEGDLLGAVRQHVGPHVPIVATLDLHAHVTAAMVENASALIAVETYPHIDTFPTGQRGATMLLDILAGKVRPTMAMAKVPVLVSGVNGGTAEGEPFGEVLRFGKQFERKSEVLSVSVFLVHPYLDLPDMGGGGLVMTDNDPQLARKLASEIAERYWQARHDLEPKVWSPAEAIARGRAVDGGPVLLVEAADCTGGGAAGDGVTTLRALLEADTDEVALVPVVDAAAAARCHEVGEGSDITLSVGHASGTKFGKPVRITGRIVTLSAGSFVYDGGTWAGSEADMGKSAVVQLGAVRILIMSHSTYDWADEQFRSVGLHAREAKFVVVKNPMNYRLGYKDTAKAAYILDTPGPTPATLRNVKYRNVKRPYFPADQDIADVKPTVHVSR